MAKVKYGNVGTLQDQVVLPTGAIDSVQGIVYGQVTHQYTYSHALVFQKNGGTWYIANDYRVCDVCGQIVPRFNCWRGHGHIHDTIHAVQE